MGLIFPFTYCVHNISTTFLLLHNFLMFSPLPLLPSLQEEGISFELAQLEVMHLHISYVQNWFRSVPNGQII
jgi:hypothetical protein